MSTSKIWAITAYYNPIGYTNRLLNYKKFKKYLGIPLVTVELISESEPELKYDDADIVVHVRSESILWHKERLLNIALKHLPQHVEIVAWLDCDIIFADTKWFEKASNKLNTVHLCQLFTSMYDLQPNFDHREVDVSGANASGHSIASMNWGGSDWQSAFHPKSNLSMRRGLFGLAWAARKELVERFGFYDMMVIGSGDRALACAGYGRFDDAINTAHLTDNRKVHYLNWAIPFYEHVKGMIGGIDGDIFHLWHGDLANRKYLERHESFSKLGFDPYHHIHLNQDDCWEWHSKPNPFEIFVTDYLIRRDEDG